MRFHSSTAKAMVPCEGGWMTLGAERLISLRRGLYLADEVSKGGLPCSEVAGKTADLKLLTQKGRF